MKNSTDHISKKPLSELITHLQATEAVVAISEKIDRAFQALQPGSAANVSYRDFNDAIAGLVKHLYQDGLSISRTTTLKSALSEGLDLLDLYYESGDSQGLETAYLDATDKDGRGLDFVLLQLAKIIKEREVRRYLNYQYLSAIDPTDRDAHRQIAESLIEEQGPHPPDDFRSGNPVRFAKYYRDLLELVISSDAFVAQIKNSSRTFPGT